MRITSKSGDICSVLINVPLLRPAEAKSLTESIMALGFPSRISITKLTQEDRVDNLSIGKKGRA